MVNGLEDWREGGVGEVGSGLVIKSDGHDMIELGEIGVMPPRPLQASSCSP